MYQCQTCSDEFHDTQSCEDHMDDFGHWQCETCSRTFRSQHAANQHMNVKDHWPGCERCDRRFGTLRASRQHMRDKDHWPEYETCDREVMTQSAFDINMDDDDHWPRCETCSLAFHNQSECDEHMDREDHWKNYCKQCELHCRDESSFRAHKLSRYHIGQRIQCPNCENMFTTVTGLSHHLEMGSCACAPSVNRRSIYREIARRDPYQSITIKTSGQICRSHGAKDVHRAIDNACNGYGWECDTCQRTFATSLGLSQHITSPVHQQNLYHCPNNICAKEFVALAGLFQHLESETCRWMRWDIVQELRVDLLGPGNGIITCERSVV